jgi:hypothetical protein
MKITRHYIYTENEETGMTGFVPLWIPRSGGFDPSGFIGMIHDALEHRLCDTGKLHEEAMAFGRLMALRGVYSGQKMNARALGQEFGGVVHTALSSESYRGGELMPNVRIKPMGEERVRSRFAELVSNCRDMLNRELDNDGYDDGFKQMPDGEFFGRMFRWLNVGYYDALRRYGGYDGCRQVGDLFLLAERHRQKDEFDLLSKEAEDEARMQGLGLMSSPVMKMVFDTANTYIKMTLIGSNAERGNHQMWLRKRIARWATQ